MNNQRNNKEAQSSSIHQNTNILLTAGKLVQHTVTLRDELDYVYRLLKRPEQKVFRYKKLVRTIRESHGMLKLLQTVKESQAQAKKLYHDNSTKLDERLQIDCFIDLVMREKLITPEKLLKLRYQHDDIYIKSQSIIQSNHTQDYSYLITPCIEEYYFEQQQNHQAVERNASEGSCLSYFESFGKRSKQQVRAKENKMNAALGSGVLIQRDFNSRHLQTQTCKSIKLRHVEVNTDGQLKDIVSSFECSFSISQANQ